MQIIKNYLKELIESSKVNKLREEIIEGNRILKIY